jgi:acetylornithine deacetylase
VPSKLTSEIRIGVAPHETVDEVEAAYRRRLDRVIEGSEWLSAHPPTFERFSVQFEGAEIDREEPIVTALAGTLRQAGIEPTYRGFTAGTDARHYIAAGIPTVVFGPGTTDVAHQPDESVAWDDLVRGSELIAGTAATYLREQ